VPVISELIGKAAVPGCLPFELWHLLAGALEVTPHFTTIKLIAITPPLHLVSTLGLKSPINHAIASEGLSVDSQIKPSQAIRTYIKRSIHHETCLPQQTTSGPRVDHQFLASDSYAVCVLQGLKPAIISEAQAGHFFSVHPHCLSRAFHPPLV